MSSISDGRCLLLFSYCSGMNLTMPIGKYDFQGTVLYIYSSRNGYRAPAFHQLDFSGGSSYEERNSYLFDY